MLRILAPETHALTEPLEFTLPSGSVRVTQFGFRFQLTGGWYVQQVTLDATHGIYDWLRHRVHLAPGPGQFMVQFMVQGSRPPCGLADRQTSRQRVEGHHGPSRWRSVLWHGAGARASGSRKCARFCWTLPSDSRSQTEVYPPDDSDGRSLTGELASASLIGGVLTDEIQKRGSLST